MSLANKNIMHITVSGTQKKNCKFEYLEAQET